MTPATDEDGADSFDPHGDRFESRGGSFDPRSEWGRVGAIAAMAALPWTVILYPGEFDLVFSWGLVNTNPLTVVDLHSYLFEFTRGPRTLPNRLLAWPIATLAYAGALASAAVGAAWGREDWRVTAALLICAAVANVRFTHGAATPESTAVPLGAAAIAVVLWWFYWPIAREGGWIGRR